MDATLALLLAVLTLPLVLLVALTVRICFGRPVLFRQRRPGLHEKPFTLLKFRTMTDGVDRYGRLLPDALRLTPVGQLLRRTSLDELPELLNVIKGEMSLVGPRPLLMEYLSRYSDQERGRHSIRPGMTGLAQVAGRNALSWEEKFRLDLTYVENVSFLLDVRIIARTIVAVLSGHGIAQPGTVTADKFQGSSRQ